MNRRQRRAQQTSSTMDSDIKSADDIPLSRPPESDLSDNKTKPKTLLEIAAERQSKLGLNFAPIDPSKNANIVNVKIDQAGNIIQAPSNPIPVTENEVSINELSPWLDTLLLATSLSALHFTLEVLTVHQYAQELRFQPIIMHTAFVAFPTLILLIHLFHGHLVPAGLYQGCSENVLRLFNALKQLLYMGIANLAGCYLIQLTNDRGYYAVMKNAPSIGTIWVWAILELGLLGALVGVIGPGIYAWWNGYGVF